MARLWQRGKPGLLCLSRTQGREAAHRGVIPKAVDEYLQMRGNYAAQEPDKKLGNPVHHVHVARGQDVPQAVLPVSYGLLLNLVGVMGADASKEQIWRYLDRKSTR